MRRLAFILALLSLISCGDSAPSFPTDSTLQSLVLDSTSSRWPEPRAIPVCIINRSEVGDFLFTDIKNYVEQEYASKAGVRFTGWNECIDNDLSAAIIRVQFNRIYNWSDSSSSAVIAGGGLSLVGMSQRACGSNCAGGTMRLDIGTIGEYPENSSTLTFIRNRSRASAIHEFGHALGLMHEHSREDAVNCALADNAISNQDPFVYVGSYDSESIMNYCHASSVLTLSRGDIQGVWYLYPTLAIGH